MRQKTEQTHGSKRYFVSFGRHCAEDITGGSVAFYSGMMNEFVEQSRFNTELEFHRNEVFIQPLFGKCV
jgi:hypothetical protein